AGDLADRRGRRRRAVPRGRRQRAGTRGLGVHRHGDRHRPRRRDAVHRAVPGRHAVHPGRGRQPDHRERVLDALHAEDHDVGRGGVHPDRARLPGLDVLGVPPADRHGPHPRERDRAGAMKPLDPRLLRYARTTRGFLLASVALGAATAGLIIAQATLLAEMIARAFLGGASLADLRTPMLLLLGVVAGRTLVAWLQEVAAHRSSAAVKSQLRGRLLEHALRLGPRWLAGERSGELATLATRGVDALDDYFSRYLPQ